ncbi:pilus assembly PilX family protein [Chondromyces crocatus]|uniref:Type 4 fimbrial biogenesis protein PilX N-terminal domain-containing protein n=1 Tax=Chondromyces crocatus TaxID=52 RepID=A0A0K1EFB1_CHOCO|nr:PilX N-terminal domain-containing pilus assembly protein [Chondromyces crocatus]AKT39382.1 uncharacterized protein CMC5_035290 [Chondromyces crocatus]
MVISPHLSRVRARSRERGAAVFIVVLLVAMLTAIGVFAAHAASLSTISSGYARQSTQARYLTELALQATIAQLDNADIGPSLIQESRRKDAYVCDASAPERCCFAAEPGDRCFRFSREALEGFTGSLVVPYTPTIPGSLGKADLQYRIEVEMSDFSRARPPPPGMDLTSAGAVNTDAVMVTLNATSVVYPAPGPNAPMDDKTLVAMSGNQELLSAHVVVINVPIK